MSKNTLVIVESPSKAKTIKKYLGSGFNVIASMGHIRDLPKSTLGIDIENNFEPSYITLKDKKEIIEKIKEKASKSSDILLATDPDREGEAIAWHLAHVLKLKSDQKNRVSFNEITKDGIFIGIKNIRSINLSLVNSQQARRILDRLVGYKLSPFLCQKIHKGLSAGRVQSVALKILNDREREIANFNPEEYWTISVILSKEKDGIPFVSNFWGTTNEEIKLKNEDDVLDILTKLENAKYIVADIKKGKRKRNPPPPFITSTLQQDAIKKLNFSSKKTMKIAQELYEGINIDGYGPIGLITYMRTDSTRLSEESICKISSFIREKWGDKYLNKRVFKKKSNSQDAHEAIRPTVPSLDPESARKNLSNDQYKLYKLIWNRFTASQMSCCLMNTIQVKILANNYIFKSSGSSVFFDGFTILYDDNKDVSKEEKNIIPDLEINSECFFHKIDKSQHFTEPPPRYTEASLIKTLEEDGIGRPSTYASIISTILNREYATSDNKRFFVSELGKEVNKLLEEYFSSIINIQFTANMESDLDKIENNNCNWKTVIHNFYGDFETVLKNVKRETKDLKIYLKENETDEICSVCGAPMVVKRSKFGKFLGCSKYPDCKNIKKFVKSTGVKCPKCNGDIIKKSTKKKKTFYGCSNYPSCDFASWNQPIGKMCITCGSPLFIKNKEFFCEICESKEKE